MKKIATLLAAAMITSFAASNASAQVGSALYLLRQAKQAADNKKDKDKDKSKGSDTKDNSKTAEQQAGPAINPDGVTRVRRGNGALTCSYQGLALGSLGGPYDLIQSTPEFDEARNNYLQGLADKNLAMFYYTKPDLLKHSINYFQREEAERLEKKASDFVNEYLEEGNDDFGSLHTNLMRKVGEAKDDETKKILINRLIDKYNLYSCSSRMNNKVTDEQLRKCYNDIIAFKNSHKNIILMLINLDPDGNPIGGNGRVVFRTDPIPQGDQFYNNHPSRLNPWLLNREGRLKVSQSDYNYTSKDFGHVESDGSVYTTNKCTTAERFLCKIGNNGQIYNKAGVQIGQIDGDYHIWKGPKGAMKDCGYVGHDGKCYLGTTFVGWIDNNNYVCNPNKWILADSPYEGTIHFALMVFLFSIFQ
ncbi:MAG: hypothetical protein MJZ61_03370 [Bacteroidales bacterium]|nr:hypothetical protein [Bacteroidales bacterium]